MLFTLGIKKRNTKQFYEYQNIDNPDYITYIDEDAYQQLHIDIRKNVRKATIYKFSEQNPRGNLIYFVLHSEEGSSQEFILTANWAPFQDYHFIIFAKNNGLTALKQKYHSGRTLEWIDDLFTKLKSVNYSLFFNSQGAGQSMDTLHFQLIKNEFPVFTTLNKTYNNYYPGLIRTNINDWPFEGILARYTQETKNEAFKQLNMEINEWISNPENTFNLLFRIKNDEYREFFFVFRKKGLNYIKGISNGIAGYEVAGNIIIENREEYEKFPDNIDEFFLSETP